MLAVSWIEQERIGRAGENDRSEGENEQRNEQENEQGIEQELLGEGVD